MAFLKHLVPLLLLASFAFSLSFPLAEAKGSVEALEKLRSLSWEAKDGVILVNDEAQLKPLVEGKDRPYSLVISVQLTPDMLQREGVKTQKHAKNLYESFKAAVKKYRSAFKKENESVFFILMEYNIETQDLFQKLEIQSFPTSVVIPRQKKISFSDPTFQISSYDRCTDSKKSEFFEFLEESFSLGIFDTKDDKVSLSIFNIVVGYSLIIAMGKMLYEFSKKGLIVPLMAVGSIAVFWFSTSGVIKCIIHNLPMVIQDRNGNPQVFVADNRQQTILEGCMMSTAYVALALCLSSFTFFFPYVKNESVKTMALYTTFVVGCMAYFFIIDCFQWKSHMRTMVYGWNV
jgi:hypothetical protein